MKVLKVGLYIVAALVGAGVGGFFALGQHSQAGSATGLVDGRLAPCPASPNCVSSEPGTDPQKAVQPLPIASWDAVPAAIAGAGGKVIRQDDDYIAAEFTSALFGFVDDVELRRTEDAVHIRSASRVGESDMGVNAGRVDELREALLR
jgi:uncharacterized protein (DUF1499 family)